MEMLIKIKEILLPIHIICGSIGLILFWIPVMTRKGGKVHRLTGRYYMYFMWVVVVSAALMSIINACIGQPIMAAFLGYLSLLTAYPMWYAWEIFNHKQGISPVYYRTRRYFNITLVATGVALIIYGLYLGLGGVGVLMIFFGAISLPAIMEVRKSIAEVGQRPPIIEHIRGTIISGIAGYTAFLSFGSRALFGNVFADGLMWIPWILPTIIGVTIINIVKRSYIQ